MEVVMNHNQFLEWKYGNKTTLDIKLENLGMKDSKKFEKQLIIGIGTALFLVSNPSIVMAAVDLSSIDKLGNTFLDIVRKVGYWIALIGAIKDIIKATMRGGNSTGEIGKIIMLYILAFGSLYLMPSLFDMVKGAF